jgi:putative sugar O-methyltransferase
VITYKDKRNIFANKINLFDDRKRMSKIWLNLIKDFQINNSTLRGYGLSKFNERKINLYIFFKNILDFIFKGISYTSIKTRKVFVNALSWIVFEQQANAASKFGFDIFSRKIYDEKLMQEFLEKYRKYNIGFSHNTFKCYFYLKEIKKYVKLKKDIKIFEIGAGVFNFGHLLSLELKKFDYIICDLPEMILKAHEQITDMYIPFCHGNYEVYLPNELEKFNNSQCGRKILFITGKQLEDKTIRKSLALRRFDLFINHESFAEMSINTVNLYLDYLPMLMKKNSIINIVNRHTRPQAKSQEEFKKIKLEDITCFEDYNLKFCNLIVKKIDYFRAKIPVMQMLPNIFFIGRMK